MHSRTIKQIHQMSANGLPPQEIARLLGLNRNTVYAHLNYRVAYPPDLIQQLNLRRPLPKSPLLPLYDAAIYLPGWPSKETVRQLYLAKVLPASPGPKGLLVTLSGLREAAQKMLPPGLYFRSSTLQYFTSEEIAAACKPHRIDSKYWPVKPYGWIPGHIVGTAAREHGVSIRADAGALHRIYVTMDITGVATLG